LSLEISERRVRHEQERQELRQKLQVDERIEKLKQRIQSCQQGVKWLEEHREELVQDVAQCDGLALNYSTDTQQFKWDVDDYIDWLCYSMNLGKPIPLEEYEIIPLLPSGDYVKAFIFVKQKAVSSQISPDGFEAIEAYLDYLINHFQLLSM